MSRESQEKIALISVHASAMLLAFLGPSLKLIPANATGLVLGRSMFEFLCLLVINLWMGVRMTAKASEWPGLLLVGVLQSLQWWLFIYSLQISSVAVALITTFTFPVWLSFLEPILFREPFRKEALFSAGAILLGVYLIAPMDAISWDSYKGLLAGLLSGHLVAWIMLLTRRMVVQNSPLVISLYKSFVGVLMFFPFYSALLHIHAMDWYRLAYIAVVFSALPYVLLTHSVRFLDARRAGSIISLEPVYGVMLAALLIGEVPEFSVFAGGIIIVLSSALETLRR